MSQTISVSIFGEESRCPRCGGYNLDFDTMEIIDGDQLCQEWECLNCGATGQGVYTLKFYCHEVNIEI